MGSLEEIKSSNHQQLLSQKREIKSRWCRDPKSFRSVSPTAACLCILTGQPIPAATWRKLSFRSTGLSIYKTIRNLQEKKQSMHLHLFHPSAQCSGCCGRVVTSSCTVSPPCFSFALAPAPIQPMKCRHCLWGPVFICWWGYKEREREKRGREGGREDALGAADSITV